jgi:hypothetical protein
MEDTHMSLLRIERTLKMILAVFAGIGVFCIATPAGSSGYTGLAVNGEDAGVIGSLPITGLVSVSASKHAIDIDIGNKIATDYSTDLNFDLQAGYLHFWKFGIIALGPAEIQQDCSILDIVFGINRDDFQFEEFEKLGCSGSFHAETP